MPHVSLQARTEMRALPALLNLARLLELSGTQLHQAIQAELVSNPALEEVEREAARCHRCGGLTLERLCLRCATESLPGEGRGRPSTEDDRMLLVAAPRSPTDGLLEDLRASLPATDHAVARVVVGCLDDHGLLSESPRELARIAGVTLPRVEAVLRQLRELGPPGIAQHGPRECLLAQIDALARVGVACPHAREIVAEHLEDLGKHRYGAIARHLRLSSAEVATAHEFIRRNLWPYPLASDQGGERALDQRLYGTPDMLFDGSGPTIRVEVVTGSTLLRLNPIYAELGQRGAALAADERAHVQQHLGRARLFLRGLHQRSHTLLVVGEALARHQEGFLRNGVRQLKALTRLQIAKEVGVHESTVCRAVSDKIARLPKGELWAVDDFFAAARPVQELLRELVAGETVALNDSELAAELARQGHQIARRTVAKYREQLGILPHTQRRTARMA